jgi:16S rRNA (cytosine967-C5)-methyltransferase
MKIHRVLVNAVASTLERIFAEGVYADKAVEQVLKQNPSWGSRDRRFIAETTYEMVRWWRLVRELAGKDREHDYFFLTGVWLAFANKVLPQWREFMPIDPLAIAEKYEQLKENRVVIESIPDWLDDLAVHELGMLTWEREIHSLNMTAPVVLRVNRLKTNREQLRSALLAEGVETHELAGFPEALVLEKRQSLVQSQSLKSGLFEVQDASSQLVAPYLEVEPGMTVIDACAGAGGKALHLAALMKDRGSILSMDLEERKLQELQRRAKRAGAEIIRTRVVNDAVVRSLEDSADRLLLDVPCSGLGVLRRNPDAKWKLSPEFMDEIRETQQQILSSYSAMLKPGGLMVYATCSIMPSENQLQVEKFLEREPGFELIEDRRVMPSEGFDGFYMAKLQKNLNH